MSGGPFQMDLSLHESGFKSTNNANFDMRLMRSDACIIHRAQSMIFHIGCHAFLWSGSLAEREMLWEHTL